MLAFGAGYRFHRHLSAEIAYVDLGKLTHTGENPAPFNTSYRQEMRTRGWQIAGLASYPFSEQIEVFGKVGWAFVETKVSTTMTGPFNMVAGVPTGESDNGAVFGLGVTYHATPRFFIRAEAEFYQKLQLTQVPDLRATLGPLAQPGGSPSTRINVYSVVAGYRF